MKPIFKRLGSGLVAAALWAMAAPAGAVPGKATGAPASEPVTVAPAQDSYDGPPLVVGRGRKIKVGGYGGLGGGYTRLMGRDSGLVSLEGAVLLDHRLSLGLAGYALTRTPRGPAADDGTPREFGVGYGGFVTRYSVFGSWPVYGTFGLLLGAGAVNLHSDERDDDRWDMGFHRDDDDTWRAGTFDPFLVVQPEATLHANMTRWLRLGATVGYRFTGGVGRFGLGESDLNGLVAGAVIQAGWL